ncbi:hypothetical protein PWT90_05904 [Aphanocladium album]|nr:hypothetical protein PWT90_05904 [Aphanocladium album]
MAGGTHRHTGTAGNGVLFEVIFNNANPRKKPSHGISLSYGGQVYRCNDAESIRSVHTIDTDDEGEIASESKNCSPKRSRKPPSEVACLKQSPRRLSRKSTPVLKPPPRKLKRSRTLSPSHQSRTRSILAPFSHLSRKFAHRHSCDQSLKTKRERSPVRQEAIPGRPTREHTPPGFAYAQQPPPFAYQNQVPMYQYVPAQPQSVFATALMACPMPQTAPNVTPQCPPELQHLQARINHATCSLAANPIDLHAKQELNQLLAERNSFLDSATKTAAHLPTASARASEPLAARQPETGESSAITKEQSARTGISTQPPGKASQISAVSTESVAPGKHHICSGCGEARSPSFHRKHPFTRSVHNVCRKCRVGRRAKEVMKRYHFCSSCGIVRSKDYHRRRGNATSVSLRSQICHKCHANGDFIRNVIPQRKKRPEDEKLNEPGYSRSDSPIRAERTKSRQPTKSFSAHDRQSLEYDGASSFASSVEARKQNDAYYPENAAAFHSYRSPEVSDESISDQHESLESSFHSSDPSSSTHKNEGSAAGTYENHPRHASDSSPRQDSFHMPEQASSPYYQPRNTATRLSSPFCYTEEAPHRNPHSPIGRSESQDYSHPSNQDAGLDSPPLQRLPQPCFATRNQSWPGDLNVPSAFSGVAGTGRKASASDGAQTPQHSPTAETHAQDGNAGARFTKGAFGKSVAMGQLQRPPSRPADNEHPEPIIEEPSSPVRKSPLTTPLLLEFSLAEDMSDSGVEFLTDSSSPSSSSSSSSDDDEGIAAHLGALAVDE